MPPVTGSAPSAGARPPGRSRRVGCRSCALDHHDAPARPARGSAGGSAIRRTSRATTSPITTGARKSHVQPSDMPCHEAVVSLRLQPVGQGEAVETVGDTSGRSRSHAPASSSRWIGVRSPETSAYCSMSSAVTVWRGGDRHIADLAVVPIPRASVRRRPDHQNVPGTRSGRYRSARTGHDVVGEVRVGQVHPPDARPDRSHHAAPLAWATWGRNCWR